MIINAPLNEVILTDIIAFDTEYNNLDTKNAILIAFSISTQNKETYVFEASRYSSEELKSFFKKINTLKTVICHNAKADIGVVYSNTNILLRNGFCTMLGAQIIDNGYSNTLNMVGNLAIEAPFSLISCLKRYCNINRTSTFDKKRLQKSFATHNGRDRLTEEQLKYAGDDTIDLLELYQEELKYIKERELELVVKEENTLTPVLVKMEFKGSLVDVNLHKQNIKNWEEKRKELLQKLDSIVLSLSINNPQISGGRFTNKRRFEKVAQLDIFGNISDVIENENKNNINFSSSKQLIDLFNRLNLPLPKTKEGLDSFSEDTINDYLTKYHDSPLREFLYILLEFKEYDKLLSTYGEKFLEMLDSEKRLRTTYTQCFTNTGRLSSTEVVKKFLGANLANIPKRSDIRNIFIPDEGYSFVDCDMTGQEVAIAADFSKEPVLLNALKEGFDHHSFLASFSYSILFNKEMTIKNEDSIIEIDNIKYKLKTLRDDHKPVLFAKFYGGGAGRLKDIFASYLHKHVKPEKHLEVCTTISNTINNKLKKLISFLKEQVNFAKANGYTVANKLGRRRYYDNPEDYYGEIMNFPIQGTGADSIKIALIKLDKWYIQKAKELNIEEEELGWITLTVYDQNLCTLNDKYLHLAPEIQNIMAESLSYFLEDIKGSSDLKIKKQWSK